MQDPCGANRACAPVFADLVAWSSRPDKATNREPNLEIKAGFGRSGQAILEFHAESRSFSRKELTHAELRAFIASSKAWRITWTARSCRLTSALIRRGGPPGNRGSTSHSTR